MEFVDVPFPERIAFGAQADAMWNTALAAAISGFEETNQNWSQVRHAFDFGLAVRTASDYLLVRTHFHQMRGRARKFPLRDPIDHTVSQAAGRLTLLGGTDWQMYYRYGSGSDVYDRKITRPMAGTVTVFRTRSSVTSNANSDATISYTTGVVAISNHVGGDTYAWSGEFFIPCRYDTDRLPAVVVNKQPGSDGELLVSCESLPVVEVRE